ncbi:MAG TPA: hypothetical protein VJ873_12260, partial [bacterium]|nr:hypothetical protein [bacterium]
MEDEVSLPWIIHTSFNFLTFLNIVVGILSIVIGLIGICVGFVHSSALAFAFLIPYGVLILLSLHSGVRCTDQGLCSWFYGFSSQAVAWEELSEVTT